VTLVKICGLRDPETAVAAAKAGADFIGLVFAESKRRVTPQQCYDIIEALNAERRTPPPAEFQAPVVGEVRGLNWFGAWSEALDQAIARWRPLIVGVFAGMKADEVNDIAVTARVEIVQLSGGESRDFARKITHPVIRAVHVGHETTAEDVLDTIAEVPAAGILLDTGSTVALGGTGETFDWDVAAGVSRRVPIMLAGGLTPENVAAAVTQVEPWAVDVSTGVETGGTKDIDKIRAFIRAAKGVRVGR